MKSQIYRLFVPVVAGLLLSGCAAVRSGGPASSAAGSPNGSPSATVQPIIDSQWAQQQCDAIGVLDVPGFQLQAAFDTTAGVVAAWEEAPHFGGSGMARSPLRDFPPATRVATCWFTGPWQPTPMASRISKVPFDEGVMFVSQDGHVFQGPIGNHVSINVTRPTA